MMDRISGLVTLMIFAGLVFAFPQGIEAAGSYSKQKVVYHFNTNNMKTTASGLKNLQNHFNAVGETDLQATAIFHGGGVFTLKTSRKNPKDKKMSDIIQSRIVDLKSRGVDFNVCANTLKGKKIDYKNDLFDVKKGDIIPSGVAEISKLQIQGYTYIKP